MIKIIYGVKDSSSDCELIYPSPYNNVLLNLVRQSIIKNGPSEEIVGSSAYSIHCFRNYYVFSKINIVYDSSKRISYRAYIIALEKDETNCNFLKEIEHLERQYADGVTIQQKTTLPDSFKGDNNTAKNGIVAVYYKSQKELEEYFIINNKYRQYETIYFIDESNKGSKDPLKALKNCENVIHISTLNTGYKSNEDGTNQEKIGFQFTFTQVRIFLIVIILIGFLLGISIMWGYQYFSSKSDDIINKQIYDLSESITKINNQLAVLQNKVQNLEVSIKSLSKQPVVNQLVDDNIDKTQGVGNAGITGNNLNNKGQLPADMQIFLQSECKKMKISEIQNKIKKDDPNLKIKNYVSFSNFLILIKKKDIKNEDIKNFISQNQNNFTSTDAYVNFVNYLNTRDDFFLTSKAKNLRDIGNRTFKDLETYYGYK